MTPAREAVLMNGGQSAPDGSAIWQWDGQWWPKLGAPAQTEFGLLRGYDEAAGRVIGAGGYFSSYAELLEQF